MRFWICVLVLVAAGSASAAPPELDSWLDWTGATGWLGLRANVDSVQYSTDNLYVYAPGIPAYGIGPWPYSPNLPSLQNYRLRIPRNPTANPGMKTATPLGHIGLWRSGVAVFNALDGHSYQDSMVWNQNAVVVEARGFDSCLGHPTEHGEYHHHQNPICLYDADSTSHSPILGYAFDGFPIYGPYGYAHPDGSGGIVRVTSSYHLRHLLHRSSLPDGTMLPRSLWGPEPDSIPLGYYVEDFIFRPGTGLLDRQNGRFTVTPEYPSGIYTYVATIDSTGASAFPYTIGFHYYGITATEDFLVNQVTIGETVTTYRPIESAPDRVLARERFDLGEGLPNPTSAGARFSLRMFQDGTVRADAVDAGGRVVRALLHGALAPGIHEIFWDGRSEAGDRAPGGVYFVRVVGPGGTRSRRMVLVK